MSKCFHERTTSLALKQGAIVPDRTEPQNENEKPTVTFSRHQDWEPTRYRIGRLPNGQLVMMNKMLLHSFCGGLVRIGVNPNVAPMDWHTMRDEIGLSKHARKAIYNFAISVKARTSHWFGSYVPVPKAAWVCIQRFQNDQWVDLENYEIPTAFDDVNLDVPAGIFDIVFDKLPKVGVSSEYEDEASINPSMETAPIDVEANRSSSV